MRKKLFVVICLGFSFLPGCQHPHIMDMCPPVPFNFFLLDKNGNSLLTSPDQRVDIYYVDEKGRQNPNSGCQNCWSIRSGTQFGPYNYYYSSSSLVSRSVSGIRIFYLELNGDIDTLYLEASAPKRADCHVINQVRLNGMDPVSNLPSPAFPDMYGFVLQKKN